MQSPRSTWSGAIRLGLLNIPVTLGKATRDERERGLKDLCAEHLVPVDRSERCGSEFLCHLESGKVKGVELADGSWRKLEPGEYDRIEEATKLSVMDVLDVQPLHALPLEFATASWWIRPDKKSKGSAEQPFAILSYALEKKDYGLVVKLANSSKQKLCVITAVQGCLLLRQIPYRNELNLPGDEERSHFGVEVTDAQVDMAVQLLDASRSEKFDYGAFEDEGMKLRQEVIDRILKGEQDEQHEKQEQRKEVPDIMAQLIASVEAAKE